MPPIKASGTCMAFSATEPNAHTAAGFAAVPWSPAVELRVAGDLSATRAVATVPRICTQEVLKILGSIDEGNQTIELGFAPDDVGQDILHDAFRSETSNAVWCRRTLSNGHVTYYKALVSQEGDSTPEGDEVIWNGQLELTGERIDVNA